MIHPALHQLMHTSNLGAGSGARTRDLRMSQTPQGVARHTIALKAAL